MVRLRDFWNRQWQTSQARLAQRNSALTEEVALIEEAYEATVSIEFLQPSTERSSARPH
jgi:hypothetical protein